MGIYNNGMKESNRSKAVTNGDALRQLQGQRGHFMEH